MFKSLDYAFLARYENREIKDDLSFIHSDNLFVVLDGASSDFSNGVTIKACRTIKGSFFEHLADNNSPSEAIHHSLERANELLFQEGIDTGKKQAVSVGVVYFKEKIMYFSHLGDVRIYSFQDKELSQLTRDHTIREEDPFAEKRFDDPRALQALTQGLGLSEKSVTNVKKYPVDKRGHILITTHGLTERVSNREIQWLLEKSKDPQIICESLLDLNKRKGGRENLTTGVIRYGIFSKWFKNLVVTYCAVFLVFGLFAWVYLTGPDEADINKRPDAQYVSGQAPKVSRAIIVPERIRKIASTQTADKNVPEPQVNEPDPVTPAKVLIEKQSLMQADRTGLHDNIHKLVSEWKQSWEGTAGKDQDIKGYSSFYSKDFIAGRLNRTGWIQDKSRKGRAKEWIRITVSNIKISGPDSSGHLEVSFRQEYRSSNYSGSSSKLLILKQEEGAWKIIDERSS